MADVAGNAVVWWWYRSGGHLDVGVRKRKIARALTRLKPLLLLSCWIRWVLVVLMLLFKLTRHRYGDGCYLEFGNHCLRQHHCHHRTRQRQRQQPPPPPDSTATIGAREMSDASCFCLACPCTPKIGLQVSLWLKIEIRTVRLPYEGMM